MISLDELHVSSRKTSITHIVYSGLGGPANVMFNLLESGCFDEFNNKAIFYGVEDVCVDYVNRIQALGNSFKVIKKAPGIAIDSILKLRQALREFDTDVVMCHGTSLVLPLLIFRRSLLTGRKFKLVVRECQANHLKSRREWAGSKLALRFADSVVFLSELHREQVLERAGRSPSKCPEVAVIPNGVEISGATSSSSTRLDRLTMVSRLTPIKTHDVLINALAILRERGLKQLRLTIAGDGENRRSLVQLASQLGLTDYIDFAGTLSAQEVDSLLKETGIYVHATKGETMSNSILQAMAHKLPIVASDVHGINNMLCNNEDALLVAGNSPLMFANAVQSLHDCPEMASKLGASALESVSTKWSMTSMAKSYACLFSSLACKNVSNPS